MSDLVERLGDIYATDDHARGCQERDEAICDYDALKRYGHTPAKAAEIVLDAKRGCSLAATWIKGVRQQLEPRLTPSTHDR